MLFIETPANPTIKLTDLEGSGRIAREIGAVMVVDNTFSSPLLQQPFRFGADVVVHSMTKYLNGHSDVVAGVIVSRNVDIHAQIRSTLQTLGGTMDPHQAWLVLRGLRTLAVSLGGIETLIEHPASMTHAGIAREERLASGITDDLVRIGVGCENWEDLRDDLAQAMEKVSAKAAVRAD